MAITFFHRWFDKESDAVLLVAEFNEENADQLRAIVQGEIQVVDNQPYRLTWGEAEIAEVGDYVVSDLAGGYKVYDKEVLEATHYHQ